MSSQDDLVYVAHMLDSARKALDKASGLTREAYDGDEDRRIVLAHHLQVLGEAASRVSRNLRNSHAEIPWAEIVGMRHRIVHGYLDVDYDIVWDVVRNKLAGLVCTLEHLVPPGFA